MSGLVVYTAKSLVSYVILLLENKKLDKYNTEDCIKKLSEKLSIRGIRFDLNIKRPKLKEEKNKDEIGFIIGVLVISMIPYIRVLVILLFLITLAVFKFAMSDDE